MPDYVIKNGMVISGSGAPAFKADVAVTGDRIESIDKYNRCEMSNGCKVVDATGKIVCPGIIDAHSHADLTIYREDQNEVLKPLVKQGITTFIGGNCGMSLAPISKEHYEESKMYLEGFTGRPILSEIDWKNTAGFIEHLEKNGTLLNCALLAPHGLIRIDAMGMASRFSTSDEIRTMQRSLETCLEAGCIGMSSGLQYMPGLQSATHELIRLGEIIKKYDGLYVSHLRSYMNALPNAIDELVSVARNNNIRAQVSHIFWVPDLGIIGPLFRKAAGALIDLSKYWTLKVKLDTDIEKQLVRVFDMKHKGINVGVDVMPTTTTFTHMLAYFPPWVLQGTKADITNRLSNPRVRRMIKRDIENGDMKWPHTGRNSWSLNLFKILGWECTRIMSVVSNKNKHLEGRKIADIARERGKHPFDVTCDLLADEEFEKRTEAGKFP
ncbi:MAG TPA: D-aminoacylase, partial [bacterium]|nr:D-aminoacylase [bacterium]